MVSEQMQRYLLVVVVLIVGALGFFATRPPEKMVLTLGFCANSNWEIPGGESYAIVDAAIARFRERHPDVEVRYTSGIRADDYSEWLAEQLLAGGEPDVFAVPSADFDLYVNNGVLVDLTGLGDSDPEFSWADYYPGALAYCEAEGRRYALPVGAVPTLMFVNKTLLAREGIALPASDWTWQDFYDICARVTRDTDGDGVIDQFGVYDYGWQTAAVTNGVTLFRKDGRASYFADPRMEEVLRHLVSLHELTGGREVTARDFDMGRVAFRPFSYAAYRMYKPYPWRIKKYTGFEWDCIRLPAGPHGANVSPVATLVMGVSSRSKNQRLAWELLKEICYASEGQSALLTQSKALPARRGIVEAAAGSTDGSLSELNLTTVSTIMQEAVATSHFERYDGAILRADDTIDSIVRGELPLNNALNRLQREINSYLQE